MTVLPTSRAATRLLAGFPLALLPLLAVAGCAPATPAPVAATATTGFDAAAAETLPRALREAGVLRLATDAAYPPASSYGPDGRTVVGFEPDLAAALGRVLGLRVEVVTMPFTDTLPALLAGDVDVVMAAMTATPERDDQVDFVHYFSAGTSIVVQRGNPHGVVDLRDVCGEAVAVEAGTTQVELLQSVTADCTQPPQLVETPTTPDALLELRTGRVAAVLADYPPAAAAVSDPTSRGHYQLASTAQYAPGSYGIAVDPAHRELRDALQLALRRVHDSGEYAEVLRRWDVEDGALRPDPPAGP